MYRPQKVPPIPINTLFDITEHRSSACYLVIYEAAITMFPSQAPIPDRYMISNILLFRGLKPPTIVRM